MCFIMILWNEPILSLDGIMHEDPRCFEDVSCDTNYEKDILILTPDVM